MISNQSCERSSSLLWAADRKAGWKREILALLVTEPNLQPCKICKKLSTPFAVGFSDAISLSQPGSRTLFKPNSRTKSRKNSCYPSCCGCARVAALQHRLVQHGHMLIPACYLCRSDVPWGSRASTPEIELTWQRLAMGAETAVSLMQKWHFQGIVSLKASEVPPPAIKKMHVNAQNSVIRGCGSWY